MRPRRLLGADVPFVTVACASVRTSSPAASSLSVHWASSLYSSETLVVGTERVTTVRFIKFTPICIQNYSSHHSRMLTIHFAVMKSPESMLPISTDVQHLKDGGDRALLDPLHA